MWTKVQNINKHNVNQYVDQSTEYNLILHSSYGIVARLNHSSYGIAARLYHSSYGIAARLYHSSYGIVARLNWALDQIPMHHATAPFTIMTPISDR